MVYHKNQTRQWHDISYKCDLRRIRYKTMKIDQIMCGLWRILYRTTMWLIVQIRCTPKLELIWYDRSNKMRAIRKTRQDKDVTNLVQDHSTPKMKLNCHDLSYKVRSTMKSRNDDLIDYMGAIYVKIRTQLSWLIK